MCNELTSPNPFGKKPEQLQSKLAFSRQIIVSIRTRRPWPKEFPNALIDILFGSRLDMHLHLQTLATIGKEWDLTFRSRGYSKAYNEAPEVTLGIESATIMYMNWPRRTGEGKIVPKVCHRVMVDTENKKHNMKGVEDSGESVRHQITVAPRKGSSHKRVVTLTL